MLRILIVSATDGTDFTDGDLTGGNRGNRGEQIFYTDYTDLQGGEQNFGFGIVIFEF
jgi:hypothetical protein